METVLAGVLSAILAWLGNGLLLKIRDEQRTVMYGIPILEEILKTMSAIILGGALLGVHCLFGFLEGVLDYRVSRNFQASLYSVITHTCFGLISLWLWQLSHQLLVTLAPAIAAHILWNRYIIEKSGLNGKA